MASGGELSYDAERFTKATVKESPTLLYNNLTADLQTMAYVHMNQALMIPIASALSGDNVEKYPILSPTALVAAYQVRLVTLGAESFFVLATANGVQIYDGKGKQLMHSHALPEGKTVLTGSGAEMANHARGICSSCSADGRAQVCVGSAAGGIIVVEYDGSRFRTSTTLQVRSLFCVASAASVTSQPESTAVHLNTLCTLSCVPPSEKKTPKVPLTSDSRLRTWLYMAP